MGLDIPLFSRPRRAGLSNSLNPPAVVRRFDDFKYGFIVTNATSASEVIESTKSRSESSLLCYAGMKLEGVIWLRTVIDKLALKHNVDPHEVEEVFEDKLQVRFVEKGQRKGENVYMALGQTTSGRYLTVLFIYKPSSKHALILSARDMTATERKQYGEK